MKIIALIFFTISTALSALDAQLLNNYQHQVQMASETMESFQQLTLRTVCALPDIVSATQLSLSDKLQRLPTAPLQSAQDSFREELFSVMHLIKLPEQHFLQEEREALIGRPQYLAPLTKASAPLEHLVKKWNTIIEYFEALQTYIFHLKEDEGHWNDFANNLFQKIGGSNLSIDDLLEVNEKFAFFRSNLTLIKQANANFTAKMGEIHESMPQTFSIIEEFGRVLAISYENKARILWEVLKTCIDFPGMPASYQEIPEDYYLKNVKPLTTLLNLAKQEYDGEVSIPNAAHTTPLGSTSPMPIHSPTLRGDNRPPPNTPISAAHTPKSSSSSLDVASSPTPLSSDSISVGTPPFASTSTPLLGVSRSAPASPAIHTNQERHRGSHTQMRSRRMLPFARPASTQPRVESQPALTMFDLDSNTPELRAFSDGSHQNGNFTQRLSDAFHPINRNGVLYKFEEHSRFLMNVKFVLEPIQLLLKHYTAFEDKFIRHLSQRESILTPKASFRLHGFPLQRITKLMAQGICSFSSNGPFCFGTNGGDEEIATGLYGHMGSLQFFRKKDEYPNPIGKMFAQYWLASLFEIPCDPMALACVDDVVTLVSKTPMHMTPRPESLTRDYFNHQSDWEEKKRREFLLVQTNPSHIVGPNCLLVDDWLSKVASNELSYDSMDRYSYGMLTLFCILTQSKALGHSLVLERKSIQDKFTFRMIQYNPFLNPTFSLLKAHNSAPDTHLFVGQNILYVFPEARMQIPQDVIRDFTKHNIYLLLSFFLNQAQLQQEYFQSYISQYKLNETQDDMYPELHMGAALGLDMSSHPDTIISLIQNYNKMKRMSGLTYLDVLEELRPPEAHCYDIFDEEERVKVQKKHDHGQNLDIKILANVWANIMDGAEKTYTYEAIISRKSLSHFLKEVLKPKLDRLRETAQKGVEDCQGSPYSAKEFSLIDTQLKEFIRQVDSYSFISFETFVADLPPKIKDFFIENYSKFMQSQNTVLRDKSSSSLASLVQAPSPRSQPLRPFSWKDVPTFQTQYPDYIAAIVEATCSVDEMVQVLIANADITDMPFPQAVKLVDILLRLNENPGKFHESWKGLINYARREFYPHLPHVLRFFRRHGLEQVDESRVIERAMLKRVEDYQQTIAALARELRAREQHHDFELKIPGYVLRQLFTGRLITAGLSELEALSLTAYGDILLLPFYSSHNTQIEFDNEPGCVGLAPNPKGMAGIFELHPSVGHHYLIAGWSENFAHLFLSPHTLSNDTRTYLSGHEPVLLLLHWVHTLQKICPQTQFYSWFINKLVTNLKILQSCFLNRSDIPFREGLSATLPECVFVLDQRFQTINKAESGTVAADAANTSITSKVVNQIKRQEQDLHQISTDRRERKESANLTPIEANNYSLDRLMGGKRNMLELLEEWDAIREKCSISAPLTLADIATVILNSFNPLEYGFNILSHILTLTTECQIRIDRINCENWNNPRILEGLANAQAPLKCIELAASLRVGYPITLEKTATTYTISGTRGNIVLLCELITLFPHCGELQLHDNLLCSLTPIARTLQGIRNLTSLDLSNNPLFNLAPLASLSNLQGLKLSGTFVAPSNITDLRSLINSNTNVFTLPPRPITLGEFMQLINSASRAVTLPQLEPARYVNESSKACAPIERKLTDVIDLSTEDPLISEVAELMSKSNLEDTLMIAYRMTRLAECRPGLVLGYRDISMKNETDYAARLWSRIKGLDVRTSVKQLLFALGWKLPAGTDRQSLIFQSAQQNQLAPQNPHIKLGALPFEPFDLLRMHIALAPIEHTYFTTFLPLCRNLRILALTGQDMPTILECLPPLPQLQLLDLTRNNISSLRGLRTVGHPPQKFPLLSALILKNNCITSGNAPDYNGIGYILELEELDKVNFEHNRLTLVAPLNSKVFSFLDVRNNRIPNTRPTDNIDTHTQKCLIYPQSEMM